MRGYHPGEREAQARAGVAAAAARLEGLPKADIPPAARDFVAAQTLAIVASTAPDGRIWASPLVGAAGFLAADAHTLTVHSRSAAGDPLPANVRHDPVVGLLVIDPAGRRRMRLNGRARLRPSGDLEISAEQVYANCPKYIRRREPDLVAVAENGAPRHTASLSEWARALIARADTLYVATRHPDGGADASHRGGEPGFVQLASGVDGVELLRIPDYAGNNMFNTIGNLLVEPRAGLLIPDFEAGAVLMLSGAAQVRWSPDARTIDFQVTAALELPGALGHRWRSL
ncbi:MAG TPA: pyridoxamine 5'-phosphate oxidase family protein [Gemmatimonadales bacterium]|nr:pyridoxamine 5'-phosphate oxidase family protein [Gemmatimonadales bacterium]